MKIYLKNRISYQSSSKLKILKEELRYYMSFQVKNLNFDYNRPFPCHPHVLPHNPGPPVTPAAWFCIARSLTHVIESATSLT